MLDATASIDARLMMITSHFHSLVQDALSKGDRVQITRAVMDQYGALEPRPVFDGVRHRVFDGPVRGEWIVPPGAPPGRRVVFVHGGGLNSGSAEASRNITFSLACATRQAVLSVDYALAPEHPFPAGRDDVAEALRWAWINGPDGPNEATSLAVVGESAGAALVVAAIRDAWTRGELVPTAMVLLGSYLEFGDHPERFSSLDCIVTPEATIGARADYVPDGVEFDDPAVSPLYGDVESFRGFPPTLQQVGSTESMLSDVRRFDALLASAGVRTTVATYPMMPHIWHHYPEILPQARAAIAEAAAFITATCEEADTL